MRNPNYLRGEKFIMPDQYLPFNGDTIMCQKFLEIKEQFGIDTVLECGSAVGGTTKWFGENFKTVITTEINSEFRNVMLQRIQGLTNVVSHLGDTVDLLPSIFPYLSDKTIIFADDHWLDKNPLIDELELIAQYGLKPIIAIHDFKVPDHPELGYDTYGSIIYEWEWIRESIEKIYGKEGFRVEYNSEATGAKRGIVFIYPL